MEITLLALKYFQKTAELQHLTKTAEQLHISQPSLSRTLKSLENELGVKCFDRKGRNIVLNQYGEVLLRHTERIMQEIEDIQKEISDMKEREGMNVSLYLYAASTLISSLLMAFHKEYPDIHFFIVQQQTEMEEKTPTADLSLFSSMYPMDNDHTVTLLEEELLVAMPQDSPYANQDEITLSELSEMGFICLPKGRSLRNITDYYCQMAGFVPHIALESDNPETAREFIHTGLGVALIPCVTWHTVQSENITLKHIASPKCYRYICLSWKKDAYLSPAAQKLRDYLLQHFHEFAATSMGENEQK